jgi:hypothetical protein
MRKRQPKDFVEIRLMTLGQVLLVCCCLLIVIGWSSWALFEALLSAANKLP